MKKKIITIVVSVCVVAAAAITSVVIFNRPDNNGGNSGTTVSDLLASWNSTPDNPQADDITDVENISYTNNSANSTISNFGNVAMCGNYIYIANDKALIEYDINTNVAIELDVVPTAVMGLAASEDYLYFKSQPFRGVQRIAKEGDTIENVFYSNNCSDRMYIDGNNVFYVSSMIENKAKRLYHYDVSQGKETQLLDLVNSYFVDENYIYAICPECEGSDNTVLMRANRQTMEFEQIQLSFSPNTVFASDDELYIMGALSNDIDAKIIKVSNGAETTLPISSNSYQVYGNKLVYQTRFGNSLEVYDLMTGKITTIYKGNAKGLYVLKGRYVCYSTYGQMWYKLYDLETGETKLIYGEE